MSAILDMITSGGLLPHVYCKKVTLENHSDDIDAVTVTLDFELFQLASALSESNWLNNFNVLGANIYDSMFIEVIPFRHPNNIKKLMASNEPVHGLVGKTMANAFGDGQVSPSTVGNVYVLKQQAGDGFLPRSEVGGAFGKRLNTIFPENVDFATLGDVSEYYSPPLRMKNSTILQNLSGVFIEAPEGELHNQQNLTAGFPREETKNGQVYYVIPFRQSFKHNIKDSPNLGFLFYSMLHIPDFLTATGEFTEGDIDKIIGENLEQLVIEGPVNTEIVFKNGEPTQTREVFILSGGEVWEGSVHLHAKDFNPAPDGYAGNGGFGERKGWMVGEKHIGMSDQPYVSLFEVPNKKLQDFRRTMAEQPYDGFMGMGVDSPIFSLNEKVQGAVNLFLSPFQKESRKYLSKFGDKKSEDAHYNSVGVSYYDNDAEFSKLYLSRDRSNNARGMFFINMEEFLRNSSKIYPILFDKLPRKPRLDDPTKSIPDPDGEAILVEERNQILANSKILEVKLYRDRVKKNMVGIRRENYANDTAYEEPSFLVGTNVASESGKTGLVELFLGGNSNSLLQKFFMFSDHDVGAMSAGLYQYRIDVVLQDGTYHYLNELLKEIVSARMLVDEYYSLATGYYSDDVQTVQNKDKNWRGGEKYKNKPYFQNEAFTQQFKSAVTAHPRLTNLATNPDILLDLLRKTKYVFGLDSLGNINSLKSFLDATTGTPQGINFIIKLFDLIAKKLQNLLEVNKVKKTGSELAKASVSNGYNLANFINVNISPSDSIIHDHFTFDNLFEGLSNENIYSDYLSVVRSYGTNYYAGHGLRRVYVSDYVKRCQLDTAKFISQQPLSTKWDADISTYNAATAVIGQPVDAFTFNWAEAGYSYLSPSIVELSDSLYDPERREKRSYSYYYDTFESGAEAYLDSVAPNADTGHTDAYINWENYDRLLISLMSHSLNKKDTPHSDLTDAFSVDNIWYNDEDVVDPRKIETREAYKNVFDRYGLVVHKMANYEDFFGENFDKTAGVTGPDIKNDREEYHDSTSVPGMWLNKDFSDGRMMTHKYLRQVLFNSRQHMVAHPRLGPPVPPSYDNWDKLSNVERAYLMYNNAYFEDIQGRYKIIFDDYFAGNQQGTLSKRVGVSAFAFFHLGLQVKIEVFKPMSSGNMLFNTEEGSTIAKNDEKDWSLLTRSDINNIATNQKLFCRMIYTNDTATQGINLPILDKYFLIFQPVGLAVTEFVTQQAMTEATTPQAQTTTGGEATTTITQTPSSPITMTNQGYGNL